MCKDCTNIANHIPYQKCPICEGSGGIHQDMTLDWKYCDVCNGKKIIPMHSLQEGNIVTHTIKEGGFSATVKPAVVKYHTTQNN